MSADAETVSFRSGGLDLHGRLRLLGEDAPAVVLLSGLGFHTFEYEPFAAELDAAGWSSLSFDFRGHGRSGGRRGRWTLDDLVADCREAISFLERRHRGPAYLYGNSLGAMVAIQAGARDGRPRGVVAADCPARVADFLLTRPRRALFALAKLISPVLSLRVSVDRFYDYEQLIDDPSWVAAMRDDPLIADARRLSVPAFRALLQTWDGQRVVRGLHQPLLLIQGRADRLQPARQSQLVFEAANEPKRHAVVDTGHLPHLEAPRMLAQLVTEWASGLDRSP